MFCIRIGCVKLIRTVVERLATLRQCDIICNRGRQIKQMGKANKKESVVKRFFAKYFSNEPSISMSGSSYKGEPQRIELCFKDAASSTAGPSVSRALPFADSGLAQAVSAESGDEDGGGGGGGRGIPGGSKLLRGKESGKLGGA